MIDISVDTWLPEIADQLLSQQFLESLLDDLGNMARSKWVSVARNNLNSTKRDYINGISEVESSPGLRVITLEGFLANSVESGMSSYDMRDTLLKKGYKTSKDGHKYRSIPFRHGTPTSQGQAGTPMGATHGPSGSESRSVSPVGGSLSKSKSVELGTRIYKAAKKLKPGKSLKSDAALLTAGKHRPAYTHKTDIFSGMKRVGAPRHKQYMTFRTISNRVQDGSWIHPGITARHFAWEVEKYVEEQAPKLVKMVVKQMFGTK